MKRLITAIVISCSVACAGEGSIYSQYGIGEMILNGRGKNVGMGSVGTGMFGETFINFANPASLANISRTVISAEYQFKNYDSEDAAGTSLVNTGNINEFGLALPVYSQKKMALAFGILPYSVVGYDQRITTPAPGSGIPVTQQFEGRGGLSSAQLSLSYSPASNLALGVTGHYLFGAIYRDQSLHFGSSGFFNGSYNQTSSMSGVAVTVGGIYSGIDYLLGISGSKKMNLGATFFTGTSLDADDELLRNFSSNQDTITANNRTISLPLGFSLGISYLDRAVLYAADVTFQNWDNFKMAGVHPAEMQNSIQLGAGVEFLQSDNIVDSFFEKVSYRLGGYYRQTNVILNGQSIDEIFATGGIGFPLSFDSRMNLSLEYGIRGTTSSSLVKDTIIRLTVSVTISELMFIPPPID